MANFELIDFSGFETPGTPSTWRIAENEHFVSPSGVIVDIPTPPHSDEKYLLKFDPVVNSTPRSWASKRKEVSNLIIFSAIFQFGGAGPYLDEMTPFQIVGASGNPDVSIRWKSDSTFESDKDKWMIYDANGVQRAVSGYHPIPENTWIKLEFVYTKSSSSNCTARFYDFATGSLLLQLQVASQDFDSGDSEVGVVLTGDRLPEFGEMLSRGLPRNTWYWNSFYFADNSDGKFLVDFVVRSYRIGEPSSSSDFGQALSSGVAENMSNDSDSAQAIYGNFASGYWILDDFYTYGVPGPGPNLPEWYIPIGGKWTYHLLGTTSPGLISVYYGKLDRFGVPFIEIQVAGIRKHFWNIREQFGVGDDLVPTLDEYFISGFTNNGTIETISCLSSWCFLLCEVPPAPVYPDPALLGWDLKKKIRAPLNNVLRRGIYQSRLTRRGKVPIRMKFYRPTDPKTSIQQANRMKFASAMSAWQGLTNEEKLLYDKRAKKIGLFGRNLFIREYYQAN